MSHLNLFLFFLPLFSFNNNFPQIFLDPNITPINNYVAQLLNIQIINLNKSLCDTLSTFKKDSIRRGGVPGSSFNVNSLLYCSKVFSCQK